MRWKNFFHRTKTVLGKRREKNDKDGRSVLNVFGEVMEKNGGNYQNE